MEEREQKGARAEPECQKANGLQPQRALGGVGESCRSPARRAPGGSRLCEQDVSCQWHETHGLMGMMMGPPLVVMCRIH